MEGGGRTADNKPEAQPPSVVGRPSSTEDPLPSELYDEAYFLSACEGYDEYVRTEGEHLSRRLRQAFEFAGVAPGMRVLDLGCGRGEIVRHVARLGAASYGIDYAQAAVQLSNRAVRREAHQVPVGLAQADAKHLPFPDAVFDRVLLFDVVEHLHPWELDACLKEAARALKPGGLVVVHTAPNRWYDAYAYPVVRQVRRLMGQGARYPANPRALNVAVNTEVHVNEQDILRMRRTLKQNGFTQVKVWLDTPPQQRSESTVMSALRHVAFNWLPFAWFFEREVFATGQKP
jgi:cyclopropane fatty-acyl-phospholipid synthase-like methyltransferase